MQIIQYDKDNKSLLLKTVFGKSRLPIMPIESRVISVRKGNSTVVIVDSSLIERLEYDIEVVDNGGVYQINDARKLVITIQEDGNTLEFKKKKNSDPPLYTIPLKDIKTITVIEKQVRQTIIGRKNNLLVEILFVDNDQNVGSSSSNIDSGLPENYQNNLRSVRIDLDDKYIPILQAQFNVFKEKEINPAVRRAIAVAKNSKLCIQCAKNKYVRTYHSDHNLCSECFRHNYGKLILESPTAEYFGGHKAYLAGGAFGNYQEGRMTLTEHYLIFATEDTNPSKRWEIIIPLDSIVIERWGIEEEVRRRQVLGGGGFMDGFGAVGGGFLYDSGKAHHLVIPYVDENGIPQEPRFGASSFRGKAIKEWAATLYQQVVKEKTASASTLSPQIPNKNPAIQPPTSNNQPTAQSTGDDPLKVIKMRFAKGEISREEYEEMRKVLES